MTEPFINRLAQSLLDRPDIVAKSGNTTVHLTSASPDMRTLCGVEYDSRVTGKVNRDNWCKRCTGIFATRHWQHPHSPRVTP